MWAVRLSVYNPVNNIYYLCDVLFAAGVLHSPAEVSCGNPAASLVAPSVVDSWIFNKDLCVILPMFCSHCCASLTPRIIIWICFFTLTAMGHTAANCVFVYFNTIWSKHNLAKLVSEDTFRAFLCECVCFTCAAGYIHTPCLTHTDVTQRADRIYSCKKKTLLKQTRRLFGGHRYRHGDKQEREDRNEPECRLISSLHVNLFPHHLHMPQHTKSIFLLILICCAGERMWLQYWNLGPPSAGRALYTTISK